MDPITFSIIRHRLYRVVEEAVITLKHVSGSAITNEGHDLMVSLYQPDGSLLLGGVGFLHHLTSAAEACKAIIRRFDGQIHEDDVFLLNDPFTAALHTSDIYLLAPIHHRGQLVAWSACFVHVYDIGAMNPGGFAPEARDVYSEGFSSPGLKLVDRGELRQDLWDTLLNMVRSPEMVALDLRSMIACNNVAKERMLALVEKYGADAIAEAGATLIENSEQGLRRRLRELPDGQWGARQYFDVQGEVYRVLLTMTKSGDALTFDFTGSSPQSVHPVNCTRWASLGGVFAPLFPLLCHDITWNEGVVRPVQVIAPEGSVVNCTKPSPVSVATVGAIQSVNNAASTAIARMMAASEKHVENASAVWHANHFAVFLFGNNHRAEPAIETLTETFAGAGGARTFADGVDVGGELPNPISRMANVETLERNFPVRYLFRRRARDSAGPGRFRGGSGGEMALVLHDAAPEGIRYVLSGKGTAFPQSMGLAGGYPGAANEYVWARCDDAGAAAAARSRDELPGEHEPIGWGVYPLQGGDAVYLRWNGGGGVGDPLERDPRRVLQDLREGTISSAAARQVYGVAIEGGRTDEAETARLRGARAHRAQRSALPDEAPRISPALRLRDGHVACACCAAAIAPEGQSWKRAADLETLSLRGLPGSGRGVHPDVQLRRFSCPGCGTLLDSEVALPDDPFLKDEVQPVLPGAGRA